MVYTVIHTVCAYCVQKTSWFRIFFFIPALPTVPYLMPVVYNPPTAYEQFSGLQCMYTVLFRSIRPSRVTPICFYPGFKFLSIFQIFWDFSKMQTCQLLAKLIEIVQYSGNFKSMSHEWHWMLHHDYMYSKNTSSSNLKDLLRPLYCFIN
jgi:hypothetical protein